MRHRAIENLEARVENERADHEERERAGVARGQNVLYVLPHDATSIAQFLDPTLDRVEPESAETQVLVLTPDSETAVAVAEAATRGEAASSVRVLPVTSGRRATRLLRGGPATVVAGAPTD